MDAVICVYMELYANFEPVMCSVCEFWTKSERRNVKCEVLRYSKVSRGVFCLCLSPSPSSLGKLYIHSTLHISHRKALTCTFITYKHMHTLNLQSVLYIFCNRVLLFWRQIVNFKWGKILQSALCIQNVSSKDACTHTLSLSPYIHPLKAYLCSLYQQQHMMMRAEKVVGVITPMTP